LFTAQINNIIGSANNAFTEGDLSANQQSS